VLSTLVLIRHGEVHNPDHVVYADLPGFGLSTLGVTQARAAAGHLGGAAVDALVSSPLQRAVETTEPIATALGIEPSTDERLTEWRLGERWAGVVWEDLPDRFPGELEAYLATPTDLAFAPESILDVSERVADLVIDLGHHHPDGTAVLVSHQDPIQAVRLFLTGRDLAALQEDKPEHASVITLRHDGAGWVEVASWAPEQSPVPFPPVEPPRAT
jgi:broad specificity phosphatase PhoE